MGAIGEAREEHGVMEKWKWGSGLQANSPHSDGTKEGGGQG